MSYINSFDETRLIIINGPIARKLESRDATRSRITEPMFTMLESYWVVDSIASRLRVTVSPRIISRNLDVGDIKTLHPPPRISISTIFDLYPLFTNAKQGLQYEYVSSRFFFFQKFKFIERIVERIRSIFNRPILQNFYSKFLVFGENTFSKSCFHLEFNNLGLFPWHIASRNLQPRATCKWFLSKPFREM